MDMISNGSLKLNNNYTTGFNNSNCVAGSKTGVYAQKGDPIYQKDMDSDEDGVITFEEFKQYCIDNDLKPAQIQQMLQNRLKYQMYNETNRVSSEIREIKSDSDAVYAKEGDEDYDEEMDLNGDGKVTYEEYLKYCEEQENSQDNTQPQKTEAKKVENPDTGEERLVFQNPGKSINQYTVKEPSDAKVEKEA